MLKHVYIVNIYHFFSHAFYNNNYLTQILDCGNFILLSQLQNTKNRQNMFTSILKYQVTF